MNELEGLQESWWDGTEQWRATLTLEMHHGTNTSTEIESYFW